MELHRFSFGNLIVLSNNLGEVIVDEGVDVNVAMVNEIHAVFLSNFSASFSLLINKTNSYSSQLEALVMFGELSQIDKIAVFAPNKMAKLSADFSATIPSSQKLNIEVFTDRDQAMSWLSQD